MAVTTTRTASGAWRPDIYSYAPDDAAPDALILQVTTQAGSVDGDEPVVKVAYANDDTASFVAEGEQIPESNPELASLDIGTGKISQLVPVSREQYGQGGASQRLTASITRAITKAANIAFLTQEAPTPPAYTPPAGILQAPDIIDGGEISGNLDALSDALVAVADNDGEATHIVASPTAFGRLGKMKADDGSNVTLLGSGVEASERRLAGLPMLISTAVPANELVLVDRSAIVSAIGQVNLQVSQDFYFDRDAVAVRCTWRFGANCVRPERVARLTVADPAAAA